MLENLFALVLEVLSEMIAYCKISWTLRHKIQRG